MIKKVSIGPQCFFANCVILLQKRDQRFPREAWRHEEVLSIPRLQRGKQGLWFSHNSSSYRPPSIFAYVRYFRLFSLSSLTRVGVNHDFAPQSSIAS